MAESIRQLTRVYFIAQDAVTLYAQRTSSGPTGNEPVYEADACGAPGRKAWEMWLHESAPGVGYVEIYHKDRPTGKVKVPLTSVKAYEERWEESPYKERLEREKAEREASAAEKATAGDKAAKK